MFRIKNEKKRAKDIYKWTLSTIDYGQAKRAVGYRNSIEILNDREGVCGEMTYLYVALARASNLKAKYVRVYKDENGKKVSHACAAVYPYGYQINVDIASSIFDARHQKTKVISDAEMMALFEQWRWKKSDPEHLKKNLNN